MPIRITPGDGDYPRERCCFCFRPTDWWTLISKRSEGEEVACCELCARKNRVKDVPIKEDWCNDPRQPKTWA